MVHSVNLLPHLGARSLSHQVHAKQRPSRAGQCVAVFTDNSAVFYACLKQGSFRAPLMHSIYGEILEVIQRKRLTLLPRRIPGIRNVLADALSRSGPVTTEWKLDTHDFQRIQQWQAHSKWISWQHLVEHVAKSLPVPTTNHDRPPPSAYTDLQGNVGPDPQSTSSSACRMQIQPWAKDSLHLSFPPYQRLGNKTYTAPWSPYAPWIALRCSTKPSPTSSVEKSPTPS